MNNVPLTPCLEWAEKLAGIHPDDLSPCEREALNAHIASCSACTLVRSQYEKVATLIRNLPAEDVSTDLPPELLRLWEEETELPELKKRAVASPVVSTHTRTRPIAGYARLPRAVRIIAAVLMVGVLLGVGVWRLLALIPPHSSGVTTAGGPGGRALAIPAIPVLSQSTIYVSNGQLQAFRSDNGSLIRSYKVGDALVGTPTVVNGIIYISGKDAVYALRVSDGSILWHYRAKISTFLPPVVVGGIVYIPPYITANDHYLYALRASDGTLLWRYKASGSNEQLSLPLVANGVAYVGVEDAQNAYLEALNTRDGTLLWHRKVGKQYVAPVLAKGVIYAGTRGLVSAWRASDGLLLWQYHIGSCTGVPTVTDGVVYALADNGYVYALRATTGTPLWSYKIGDRAFSGSAPIVTSSILYAGVFTGFSSTEESYIYALSIKDGHVIWRYKVGWIVIQTLAYGNGAIYFVSVSKIPNVLYALRARNGTVLWHTEIP